VAVSGPHPFAQAGSVPVHAVTLSCNPEGHAPASIPPPPSVPPLPELDPPSPLDPAPPDPAPPDPAPPDPMPPELTPPPEPALVPELTPLPELAPLPAPGVEGLLSLLHPVAAKPALSNVPKNIQPNEGTLIVVSFTDPSILAISTGFP